MKKIISALSAMLLLISAVIFVSCSETELYSEGEGELRVVATTFVPFDLAREVGGENVTVTLLQDSGADLHNYTPTTATLSALADADVFIYIGGESDEKWVSDAIKAANNGELLTLCLMDYVKEPLHAELGNDWNEHEHEHEQDEHDHHADEHIWTSLKNAVSMTNAIAKAFCDKAPEHKAEFETRCAAYTARLSALDAEYAAAAAVARVKNVVVADRFPFVYLFHDYKIGYLAAFSGCSTEVNASFETQVGLINEAKTQKLKYILTIEGSDKTLAKTVASESGCEVLMLDSLQSVKRSDIESGITYIDIMRENLDVFKEVLS